MDFLQSSLLTLTSLFCPPSSGDIYTKYQLEELITTPGYLRMSLDDASSSPSTLRDIARNTLSSAALVVDEFIASTTRKLKLILQDSDPLLWQHFGLGLGIGLLILLVLSFFPGKLHTAYFTCTIFGFFSDARATAHSFNVNVVLCSIYL